MAMGVSQGRLSGFVGNNTDIFLPHSCLAFVFLLLQRLWEGGVLLAPGNPTSFLFTTPRPQVSLLGFPLWSPTGLLSPTPSPLSHLINTFS